MLTILFQVSGERGIRTPGASQHDGFQDRCNRPLYHLSYSEGLASCSKASAKVMGFIYISKFFRGNFIRKAYFFHFRAFSGILFMFLPSYKLCHNRQNE